VSIIGFLVNLVGIFAFDSHSMHHGHHHGSDEHSHHCEHDEHSHHHHHASGSNHETVLLINDEHQRIHHHHHHHDHHPHDHGHHHHHHNHGHGENNALMHGMFLHVMADALGSLGVITSSLLIKHFNWVRADSICSLFIAGLILVSTWPLLKQCSMAMLQCTPAPVYDQLPLIYNKIRLVPGVLTFADPHFWELSSERYVGTIKIIVDKPGDEQVIRSHVLNIFAQHAPNIRWLVVEICKDTVTL
jgi:zinc transporter 5/7